MRKTEQWEDTLKTSEPVRGRNCPEFLVLHHAATGKLSAAEERDLATHLQECLYCQSEMLEIRKLLYFEGRRRPYRVDMTTGRVLPTSPLRNFWQVLRSTSIRGLVSSLQSLRPGLPRRWAVAFALLVVLIVTGKTWVQPALAHSQPVLAAAKQVPLIRWLLPASAQEYLEAILLRDQLGSVPGNEPERWTALARQAEVHLKRAITLDARYVDVYFSLGSLYEDWYYREPAAPAAAGLLDQAEAYYKKAVELRPDHLNARRGLADVYATSGRFADEEKQYDAILAIDPKDADTQSSRGWVRLERGAYTGAISDFEAALRHDPKDWDTLSGLAFAYTATRDLAEVKKALAQMNRINPGRARLLRELLRTPQPRR